MKKIVKFLIISLCCGYITACHDISPIDSILKKHLRPVEIQGCNLKRYGEAGDGGYLLCSGLMNGIEAGYSYGINGWDGWGCEVAESLNIPMYQYDPYNITRPQCVGGKTIFFEEGVAAATYADSQGRKFDTIAKQIEKNKDQNKVLIMKMDIEGGEWESLMEASDEVLRQFNQIAIELHWIYNEALFDKIKTVLAKMHNLFFVAHIHATNCDCVSNTLFPSAVLEVLYVNKNISVVKNLSVIPELPHPQDASICPAKPECPMKASMFQ